MRHLDWSRRHQIAGEETPKRADWYRRLKPETTTVRIVGTVMLLVIMGLALMFWRLAR